MLDEFLLKSKDEILALTEEKTLQLAGDHPNSDQLKHGLPVFYKQVIEIIRHAGKPSAPPSKDINAIAKAADRGDEPAMAKAAGQPEEAELAISAGQHGIELLRLGYTLSHVVHAYGAMCQAITEVASKNNVPITASEFHALNRCLDVAIAGAVTSYQSHQDAKVQNNDGKRIGFLAHEMRNALASANVAFQSIRRGTVGVGGSTGRVLEKSLIRMEELLDQSLTGEKSAVVKPTLSLAAPKLL
jgi:hypothetical protein